MGADDEKRGHLRRVHLSLDAPGSDGKPPAGPGHGVVIVTTECITICCRPPIRAVIGAFGGSASTRIRAPCMIVRE